MNRNLLILLLSIACFLTLGACASQIESTPTSPIVLEPPITLVPPTLESTCSVITAESTPEPDPNSLFPAVSEADFSFGPIDAPVTLVEYCDFQSAGCRNISTVVAALMQNRDDVRFVFRPFPLIGVEGMDKSEKAMLAALAADKQGKFWVMYDLFFVKHEEWASLRPAEFEIWVIQEATAVGLDADQLQGAINASETTTRMMSMYEAAKKIGFPAVPVLLINGALQPPYLLDYQSISDAIGLIVLGKKQFSDCPPFNITASKKYVATIHVEKGDIVIELFPGKVPLAVNSFIFLAREGWYDGITFHRVIPGFAAQAGDPSGTGLGNPGYFFNNEVSDLKYDKPGMVGMANSGPDTNGSQFFITFAPAPHLDGSFTLFGQVLSGLEVAEQLTPRDPDQTPGLPPGDRILGVEIEEK